MAIDTSIVAPGASVTGMSSYSNQFEVPWHEDQTQTITATMTSTKGKLDGLSGYRQDTNTGVGSNVWMGQGTLSETVTTRFTNSEGGAAAVRDLKIAFSDLNRTSSYTERMQLIINGQSVTLTGPVTTLADGTTITFANNRDGDYELVNGGIQGKVGRSTDFGDQRSPKPHEVGFLTISSPNGLSSVGVSYGATKGSIFGKPNGFLYSMYLDKSTADSCLPPPCFARGTLILTARGPVAVEELRAGDLVETRDNGLQPIRWIGGTVLTGLNNRPHLLPIRIAAGALGGGAPGSDLLVSPQHRVLVRSAIAHKMFGTNEVLVAAKQLLQVEGIEIATDMTEVEYFHILFDQHEIVTSNGAASESLFTGPMALAGVGSAALEEIFEIFPELRNRDYTPEPARLLASGRMGRKLAVRHTRNRKPLTM